ncbi:hypothetical protein DL96DRAFT_1823532 [Flagelloscypha sp. PMI_526]|nr:hypothetical protein DL96DRAFT_1823532 [Flagelloscypha sp. PMI_526]
MDDNSTSMAAAAHILALMSLSPPPLQLPMVSLAAPCLDADLLAIPHTTGVDEDSARIRRALAVQNIPTPQPRPEIGGASFLFKVLRTGAGNLIDLSEPL